MTKITRHGCTVVAEFKFNATCTGCGAEYSGITARDLVQRRVHPIGACRCTECKELMEIPVPSRIYGQLKEDSPQVLQTESIVDANGNERGDLVGRQNNPPIP